MIKNNPMLFDFDDILIEPEFLSPVRSRKEVSILDERGMLPLFTAPMDTVISEENIEIFNQKGIYGILPRKTNYTEEDVSNDFRKWIAYGIGDFEKLFVEEKIQIPVGERYYALIDIANGHMSYLRDLVIRAKENIMKINKNLSILHCTASYPCEINDMNLNVISKFKKILI